MNRKTQGYLMIAAGAAILYYVFVGKKGATCPNADMGGKNFGVQGACCWCGTPVVSTSISEGGSGGVGP